MSHVVSIRCQMFCGAFHYTPVLNRVGGVYCFGSKLTAYGHQKASNTGLVMSKGVRLSLPAFLLDSRIRGAVTSWVVPLSLSDFTSIFSEYYFPASDWSRLASSLLYISKCILCLWQMFSIETITFFTSSAAPDFDFRNLSIEYPVK